MAGADADARQLPPLRDLSRRAASFLRMARLALTGAAAPAQLLAAGEEPVGGHSCDPYYKSIRTEDDWESELWPEEDDDESELLVDDDEDGASRTTGGGALMSKKSHQLTAQQPAATAAGVAFRSEDAGAAAAVEPSSSEPLMMPRRAAKRVNDAPVVDHPFGCERRGSESSSLLLVSS